MTLNHFYLGLFYRLVEDRDAETTPTKEPQIGLFSSNIEFKNKNYLIVNHFWDSVDGFYLLAILRRIDNDFSGIVLCLEASSFDLQQDFFEYYEQIQLHQVRKTQIAVCVTKSDYSDSLDSDSRRFLDECVADKRINFWSTVTRNNPTSFVEFRQRLFRMYLDHLNQRRELPEYFVVEVNDDSNTNQQIQIEDRMFDNWSVSSAAHHQGGLNTSNSKTGQR